MYVPLVTENLNNQKNTIRYFPDFGKPQYPEEAQTCIPLVGKVKKKSFPCKREKILNNQNEYIQGISIVGGKSLIIRMNTRSFPCRRKILNNQNEYKVFHL